MPLILGPSATGILPVGDGSLADLERLIPNPDNLTKATSIGHHLDEMAPAAAVQLRIELNHFFETSGEAGETYTTGTHAITAGEVTATEVVIDTGLTTDAALSTLILAIKRAGVNVTRDAAVTDNEDGTFTIEAGSNYALTAADEISYYAAI